MAKNKSGGYMYGPVLSPMDEDFKGNSSHESPDHSLTNGLPDYPKGTPRKLNEVAIYEGENFGHYGHDQRRKS